MTRAERQRRAREMRARTPRPSLRTIACALGCSVPTVRRDLDPDFDKRQRRYQRSYRLRKQLERDAILRRN